MILVIGAGIMWYQYVRERYKKGGVRTVVVGPSAERYQRSVSRIDV
jgi:hypothetical protein